MKEYTVRPVLTQSDIDEILCAFEFWNEQADYTESDTWIKILHCKHNIIEQKMKDGTYDKEKQ